MKPFREEKKKIKISFRGGEGRGVKERGWEREWRGDEEDGGVGEGR